MSFDLDGLSEAERVAARDRVYGASRERPNVSPRALSRAEAIEDLLMWSAFSLSTVERPHFTPDELVAYAFQHMGMGEIERDEAVVRATIPRIVALELRGPHLHIV